MTIRLAVFDIVGTTVQAGDEVPSAFREALGEVGVHLSDADVAGIRGRSKRDAIADLLLRHMPAASATPELVEAVYARFREALGAAYRSRVRPVPGAEEVLRHLLRAGVAVVLATGLDRETTRLLLESLGWDALGLSGVVTGDDVRSGRPAPDL
ncbi:MAG: HAD family hydrolase, partial [Gemmatimonadetes bacterium]|nr:HAD family hydrolase [Gemmatimonadota bacterium]